MLIPITHGSHQVQSAYVHVIDINILLGTVLMLLWI